MHVVGNALVGVELAFIRRERFAQPVQVVLIVFLGEETGFTMVLALDDVQRDAITLDAGATGHAGMLRQGKCRWPV